MIKTLRPLFYKTSLLLFVAAQATYGQQQAMFTQYMFNGLAINPAYAGSQESLSLTAVARKQWTGMEGAPSTQTFAIHSPIHNYHIALGGLLINDQIGVTRQTGVHVAYAFRIQMPKGTLSLGLQAGFTSYRSDLSRLFVKAANDPSFEGDVVNKFMPNFGTGIYYYSDRFYLGLSVPQMVRSYYQERVDVEEPAQQSRHYFLTSGYVFYLSSAIKLKPSVLVKAVQGAPLAVDLNVNALFNGVVWLGVSCRSSKSFSALTELQLTDQFRFGYAYDFGRSRQQGLNSGSHEILLNYRFAYAKTKSITPRYF